MSGRFYSPALSLHSKVGLGVLLLMARQKQPTKKQMSPPRKPWQTPKHSHPKAIFLLYTDWLWTWECNYLAVRGTHRRVIEFYKKGKMASRNENGLASYQVISPSQEHLATYGYRTRPGLFQSRTNLRWLKAQETWPSSGFVLLIQGDREHGVTYAISTSLQRLRTHHVGVSKHTANWASDCALKMCYQFTPTTACHSDDWSSSTL